MWTGDGVELLAQRLEAGGFLVESLSPAKGGVVATAGLARLRDGSQVFAKTVEPVVEDLFEVESSGLRSLRHLGRVATPDVLHVSPELLVLAAQHEPPSTPEFWERLGHMVAELHTSCTGGGFGWHRDGWLGRMRQDNAWETDGYAFFAEHRVLRWLAEPLVREAFDRDERLALERLCAALPEIVPYQPAVLTHGDLWSANVLADASGAPVLIDPAVSYMWSEIDLSMFWCSPRPAGSERFFGAYADLAPLRNGWQDRMELLHLRELLSIVAHGDDDWGAAEMVRKLIAPFAIRHR
jgi:fructosamine-3-kinase